MVILADWPLLEFIYFNKYLIPTKAESGSSLLYLSDPDLAESLIVKNSTFLTPTNRQAVTHFSRR